MDVLAVGTVRQAYRGRAGKKKGLEA